MVLDKVKGHNEREILVNKTGRYNDLEIKERLPRFKLAISTLERENGKWFRCHGSGQGQRSQ